MQKKKSLKMSITILQNVGWKDDCKCTVFVPNETSLDFSHLHDMIALIHLKANPSGEIIILVRYFPSQNSGIMIFFFFLCHLKIISRR